jgi:DNA-binding transcriptional ArsR family regulator
MSAGPTPASRRSGRTPRRADPDAAIERYAELAKALSDPTRLKILKLVGDQADYPCTRLEAELNVTRPTISYHVKILAQAGLVGVHRQGRNSFYTLRPDVLDDYFPHLLERL